MNTIPQLRALLTTALLAAEPVGEPPALPQLAASPRVDGTIDPAEWRGALYVNDFHETSKALKATGIPHALRTEAYVAQSESAFHFAFRCFHDRMREIATAAADHDGPVWADDSVEAFLDAQGTGYGYYHIIVNAAGCLTDAVNRAPRRRDVGRRRPGRGPRVRGPVHDRALSALPRAQPGAEP